MVAELGEEKFAELLCVARDCALGRVEGNVVFPDSEVQKFWEQTKVISVSKGKPGSIDCR